MKTFIEHDLPSLKRVQSAEGRFYVTETGERYPSVTSVTGFTTKNAIKEWRNKIGETEAVKITTRASRRGTAIHKLCEDYLKDTISECSMFDVELFNSLKPELDKIDNIHCLETQLYSTYLKVAGTVDCIAEYDGELAIIDFKTSSKIKRKEWIDNYFLQTAAYSKMFEERVGISIDRLVIIIGVDNHAPQIFEEKRSDWLEKFKEVRYQYSLIYGL